MYISFGTCNLGAGGAGEISRFVRGTGLFAAAKEAARSGERSRLFRGRGRTA